MLLRAHNKWCQYTFLCVWGWVCESVRMWAWDLNHTARVCIYTISIIILCVSQIGHLLESNKQINDFYKWVILKSKDILDLCEVISSISKLFIQCNTGSCCMDVTGSDKIYLYMNVILLVLVCPVSVIWDPNT